MQQKLDDLCQQLSLVKVSGHDDDLESKFKEKLLCDQHHHSSSVIQVCVCVCVCALAFTWRFMFLMLLLFRINLPQMWWLKLSKKKGVCLTCQIGVLVSLLLQNSMYVCILKQSL